MLAESILLAVFTLEGLVLAWMVGNGGTEGRGVQICEFVDSRAEFFLDVADAGSVSMLCMVVYV